MSPDAPQTPDDQSEQEEASADVGFEHAARKVKTFPTTPGVYLMKDAAGRVIYVGKAKNLRSRGSYFLKAAAEDTRTGHWIGEICDIDYIDAESEVDALLMESRLIKDIQPKFNKFQKDGKTFPYLMITQREDYPRVEVTRTPPTSGAKLYGPFLSSKALHGAIQVLQRIFRFRTCSLDIDAEDPKWRWFRPCLLASIDQCTAPCNLRISKEEYRKAIKHLQLFLEGKRKSLVRELETEMKEAAGQLDFEKAAQLRDEIDMLGALDKRGDLEMHAQPEAFVIDPKKGLNGLRQVLHLSETPRVIEGVDIAHLSGKETVASLVQFIDGLPSKAGYRRFKIREVEGVDDFRSIYEVISRRFKGLQDEGIAFPDLLLIDGGRGQLSAAMRAFDDLRITPPTVISIAKREEEIYTVDREEPIRLSRNSYALRLLQFVRDEAHRFAQHYHHILRSKKTFDD